MNKRLFLAQEKLTKSNLDAFIVESSTEIYYLTYGKGFSGTMILTPKTVVLFVSSLDFHLHSHELSNIMEVVEVKDSEKDFANQVKTKYSRLGYDPLVTTCSSYNKYEKQFSSELIPEMGFISLLRMIKDDDEKTLLKQAADLGSRGYDYTISNLHLGIKEKEVVRLLKEFWAGQGAEGESFEPIIVFGENTGYPHAKSGERRLKKGDLVLIDIGVKLNGYCSDMTRVLSFGDYPQEKLREAYKAVAKAQKLAIESCLIAEDFFSIDHIARNELKKENLDRFFSHSLGHGIGLEVHELPFLGTRGKGVKISSGTVFTIEPGVYFPGEGGIRIEDTIMVDGSHVFSLTKRPVSPEITVVER